MKGSHRSRGVKCACGKAISNESTQCNQCLARTRRGATSARQAAPPAKWACKPARPARVRSPEAARQRAIVATLDADLLVRMAAK